MPIPLVAVGVGVAGLFGLAYAFFSRGDEDKSSAPRANDGGPTGEGRLPDPDIMRVAVDVLTDLRTVGCAYNRELMRRFQTLVGIIPDGLYGPITRGALAYYAARLTPPVPEAGIPPICVTLRSGQTATVPYNPPS